MTLGDMDENLADGFLGECFGEEIECKVEPMVVEKLMVGTGVGEAIDALYLGFG